MLELLLGIGIFSIIILAVYSVFWSGTRLSYYSNQQGKLYREMRWTLSLMNDELENAVPYDFTNSYPDKKSFIGEHNQITFLNATDKGLRVISYHLESSSNDKVHRVLIGQTYTKNVNINLTNEPGRTTYCLVREEKSFLDFVNGVSDENTETEIIGSRVQQDGLQIFYGVSKDKDKSITTWENEWKGKGIPAQVRLEVDFSIPVQGNENLAMTFSKDIFIPPGSLGNEQSGEQKQSEEAPSGEGE